MRFIIRNYYRKFEIMAWYDASPEANYKIFRGKFSALSFLRSFLNHPTSMMTLRRFICGSDVINGSPRFNDHKVFELLAGRLVSGHVKILELADRRHGWRFGEPTEPKEPPEPAKDRPAVIPPGAVVPETTWIEIQLIDEAGEPLPDVTCIIVDPDSAEHQGRTDPEGIFRVEDIPEGNCKVRFPDLGFAQK